MPFMNMRATKAITTCSTLLVALAPRRRRNEVNADGRLHIYGSVSSSVGCVGASRLRSGIRHQPTGETAGQSAEDGVDQSPRLDSRRSRRPGRQGRYMDGRRRKSEYSAAPGVHERVTVAWHGGDG